MGNGSSSLPVSNNFLFALEAITFDQGTVQKKRSAVRELNLLVQETTESLSPIVLNAVPDDQIRIQQLLSFLVIALGPPLSSFSHRFALQSHRPHCLSLCLYCSTPSIPASIKQLGHLAES